MSFELIYARTASLYLMGFASLEDQQRLDTINVVKVFNRHR